MLRKIVCIDQEKCNGCGACASACHENAIGMVDGKAKLLRDDYCDGMGDCLPECPVGAISFEMREAAAYDEAAVKANQMRAAMNVKPAKEPYTGGCPGTRIRTMNPDEAARTKATCSAISQLQNWPVQIKLAPVKSPYFDGAKLLIAADCAAYAYAAFHQDFMRGKVTVIGCPKLDAVDYSEKLTQIVAENDIQSITLARMQVPCCGGLEMAAKKAVANSGKEISVETITITAEGNILK